LYYKNVVFILGQYKVLSVYSIIFTG